MREWFWNTVLRDEAGDSEGSAAVIDPESQDDAGEDEASKDKDKGKEGPSVQELQRQIDESNKAAERARKEAREAIEDAKYWAAEARKAGKSTPAAATTPKADEKPTQLLDDLTVEGAKALEKRGYITKDELGPLVQKIEERIREEVSGAREGAEFDLRMRREFPEIAEESDRIDADPSYEPKDPLFIRARELYKELVTADPKMKGQQGTAFAAAKMAKAELDKGEGVNSRQSTRRDRIESRQPARSRSSRADEDGGGRSEVNSTAREVGKLLSQHVPGGLKDDDYLKQLERER